MRIRDSEMPDELLWESLFDVPLILSRLGIERFHDVVDFTTCAQTRPLLSSIFLSMLPFNF